MNRKWLAVMVASAMILGLVPGVFAAADADDLAGYWSFDEQVYYRMVHDLSGNENHLTMWGPSTCLDFTNIAPVPDNLASLSIPGSPNFAYVPDSPTLDIVGAITVAAWVKLEALESGKFYTVAGKWNDRDGPYRGYLLGILDGRPGFYISPDGAGERSAGSSTQLTTGQFYHLVGVYDGEYLRIYVDGVEMNSTYLEDGPSIAANDQNLHIGGDRAGGDNAKSLTGYVDELAIFSHALSEAEIGILLEHGVSRLLTPPSADELEWLPPVTNLTDFVRINLPLRFRLLDGDTGEVIEAVQDVYVELTGSEYTHTIVLGDGRDDLRFDDGVYSANIHAHHLELEDGTYTATVYADGRCLGDVSFEIRSPKRGKGGMGQSLRPNWQATPSQYRGPSLPAKPTGSE